jgi:hypothetical protein
LLAAVADDHRHHPRQQERVESCREPGGSAAVIGLSLAPLPRLVRRASLTVRDPLRHRVSPCVLCHGVLGGPVMKRHVHTLLGLFVGMSLVTGVIVPGSARADNQQDRVTEVSPKTAGGGCGRRPGGVKIRSGGPGDVVYRLV